MVESTCLENKRGETYREFESLPLRVICGEGFSRLSDFKCWRDPDFHLKVREIRRIPVSPFFQRQGVLPFFRVLTIIKWMVT